MPSDLKVGDRIRIIGIPGEGVPGYFLHRDTRLAYQKLIARGRSVRIARIGEDGLAWYSFRFPMKDGRWDWHEMAVCDSDNNWVKVKPHHKKQQRWRAPPLSSTALETKLPTMKRKSRLSGTFQPKPR
jgi:hypothetical protein